MRKFLLSFTATLFLGLFSFFQAHSQCAASDVAAPANQILCVGSATAAVNFTGSVSGTTFKWTNSKPSIGLGASGTGDIPSFTATNSTGAPITATVTVTPYKGATDFAYITNYNANKVSVINTADNSVVTTINVGTGPEGLTVSPDGSKIYVGNWGSNNISVINTATNTVSATIPLTAAPGNVAISPDGLRLYVVNTINHTVSVINTADNTVMAILNVGNSPLGISISSDGTKVYVANYGSDNISVINAENNTIIKTVDVGDQPFALEISPDGSKVYVANYGSNSVSVINTSTYTVSNTISVGSNPYGATFSLDGAQAYIANNGSNTVSVINTSDNTVTKTIAVGSSPTGVSVSPDGTKAYIANRISYTISVINTATNTVSATIPVASTPSIYGKNIFSKYNSCTAGSSKAFTITVNPTSDVTAVANQTFCAGSSSSDINFTGSTTGTAFRWTNNYTATGLMASGSGKISSFIPINPTAVPLLSTITVTPYTGTKVYAYIPNYTSKDLAVIDVSTGTQIKSINLGETPTGVMASPDGLRVYIAKFTSIDFINTITNTVDGGIYIGSFIYGVAVSPDGSKVYATHLNESKVTVANTQTGQMNTITVGMNPYGIAVSPDGTKVYVVNAGSNTVSVINAATNVVSATINVGADPRSVVVSPDGSKVYVVNRVAKTVSVINTTTNTLSTTITVGNGPENIAITPDGSKLYVSNKSSNTVSVINAASNTVEATVTVGASPNGVSVTPDGSKVYVANGAAYTVSIIDAATNAVSATIPAVGSQPIGVGNMMATVPTCAGTPKTFTITVNPIVAISTHPVSQTKCVGNTVTFSVDATGSGLTYQWRKGTANISEATSRTYTISSVSAADAGDYSVVVSGSCGSPLASSTASLTVNSLPSTPTITASSTSICSGSSVTLTSSSTIGNQWYKNGSLLTGATGQAYTASAAGDYTVQVTTSGCASAMSASTTLTISSGVPATPTINYSGSTTFCSGGSVTLTSSAATGNQWYNGTTAIAGATNQTYTATTTGDYTVKVTNDCGTSPTSTAVGVTVKFKPAIPLITALGNVLTSSASSGNQWYLNNTALSGATAQTYQVQESGHYTVQVTQDGCTSTSADFNFVPTRIEEPTAWNGEVLVYPNPMEKILTVKNTTGHKLHVQLYNNLGQTVYDCKLVGTQSSISVEGLTRGTYQLMITDVQKGKSISQTILKK